MSKFLSLFLMVGLLALLGAPLQAQSTYKRTVTVEFDAPPADFTIDVAKLKFNKNIAYSLTIDDGLADVWNVAFPLVNGKPVTENATYAGINYGSGAPFTKVGGYNTDDGCGHDVRFKLGVALNAGFISDASESRLNWSEVDSIYQAGWDILNHSYTHDDALPIDFQQEIETNSTVINDHLGFYPRHFAIPANLPVYAAETANWGMKGTYGAVHGFLGEFSDGYWAVDDVSSVNTQLQLMRTSVPIDGASANLPALQNSFNNVAAAAQTSPVWYNEYTHAVRAEAGVFPNSSNLGFQLLKDYLNFIETDYGDQVWVAGLQEVEEYLYVRQNSAILNPTVQGNSLTFDVVLDASQPDQRHFDISLIVSALGANVTSISVQGNEYATTNPATGLVNLALAPVTCQDYVISADTYFNADEMPGPYGKITVQSGATLHITPGSELRFCTGGELIVEPGAKVNLLGDLIADDVHWKGVHLLKNNSASGQFRSYQGALIKNADFGILAEANTSYVSSSIPIVCERTTFLNNHQGVNISSNSASFLECNFENNNTYQHPFGFSAFAKLNDIIGGAVHFSNCDFNELRDGVLLQDNGIMASNAAYIVE